MTYQSFTFEGSVSSEDLDAVVNAYIEAALWSSTTEDGTPMDSDYGPDDLDPETEEQMRIDCEQFIEEAGDLLLDWDPSQVGHDFWLSRNHHGTGFWDRERGDVGDQLTSIAEGFGDCNLEVDPYGKIQIL